MLTTIVSYAAATFAVALVLWLPLRGTRVGTFFARVAGLAAACFFLPALLASVGGPTSDDGCAGALVILLVVASIGAYIVLTIRRRLTGTRPPTSRPRRRYQHRTNDRLADILERFTEHDDA